jgi:hypothetical protein
VSHQRGPARILLAVALAAIGACQRQEPVASAPPPSPAPVAIHLAPSYPTTIDRAAYAGSQACAPCHAAEYKAWLASPHGRSVVPASAATILGDFSARPLAVEGGEIAFVREGDRFFMETRGKRETKRHAVDLAIGSGRQHQDYFTHDVDAATGVESWHLLPAIWVTPKGPWISSSLYQGGSLDPQSPGWWRKRSLVELGCANCHVSQGGYRLGSGDPVPTWTETRVNCESCHGPAAEHIAKKSASLPGGALRDLTNIGPVEEARLCGVCHGDRAGHRAGSDKAGWPWFEAATLRHAGLRVDGTQQLTTYQYSGHVLSECFRGGGLLCSSCHAPHTGRPRALDHESAEGAKSDRQCTACHRNLLEEKAARMHAHHQKTRRCIDCHMAPSWISDTPERHQRTADHTISIPRPQESIEFGTPDACTTCHAGKSAAWALEQLRGWGAQKALGVRPWVRAIALGRRRAPEASGALAAILADPKSGQYRVASALDLLEAQSADLQVAPSIEPWTHDEDPWVRALALRALLQHDRAHAGEIWLRGISDPHPLVRITLLPRGPPGALTGALLDQFLRDDLDWAQRPEIGELVNVARGFASIGEKQRAFDVLEMIDHAGTMNELDEQHLGALRAALTGAGASAVSR